MRLFTISLALLTALALTACASKSSSSSSDQSSAESAAVASAPANGGEAASPEASAAEMSSPAAAGDVPNYPGATTSYSATSGGSSGTVMTTDDSFDKVYSWYQQHLPAGSEKVHTTAPVQSAVFAVGPTNDVTSVTIAVANGKTTISIAHQKT